MVTPFEQVAKAFSHKPTLLSFDEDDANKVKHDGQVPGFLYVLDVEVGPADLELLPGTAETHWQTQRDLPLKLVGEVPIDEPPQLSADQIAQMRRDHPQIESGSGFIGAPDADGPNTGP